MDDIHTIIVGAGQAGLAVSHELGRCGVEHVVLEGGRVAEAWRRRWDSFCLVTPNWSVQLPGFPYDGDDPDGFMPRNDIVSHLERYAKASAVPVREGVEVVSLETTPRGRFLVRTSSGDLRAANVVLATGPYQRPHRPAGASTLPADLLQIDIAEYDRPDALPDGGVLIVGSGQSGCQIAEELHEAGREVVLACGRAPWAPRRIGERDLLWWLHESGFLDAPVESLPTPAARLSANILATGHGRGHDLHLRTLRALGVTLAGRFLGADARRAHFAPDLADSIAWGDERFLQIMTLVRNVAADRGIPPPEIDPPEPFDPSAPAAVDLSRFGAVIFAGGFRPDYHSWLPWPQAFDDLGFPIQRDGACTVIAGLYFVGVHFLRKRKSSLLIGVGEDAALVARAIAARR